MVKKVSKKKVVSASRSRGSRVAVRGKSKKVKKNVLNPWFEKEKDSVWTFSPINRGGYIALFLLFFINLFAAAYFNLQEFVLDNYLKMGVVLFLSVFIFYEICRRRIRK